MLKHVTVFERRSFMSRSLLVCVLLLPATLNAQAQGRGARRGGPPPTPRSAAAFDMTGYWVSIVTEDWRWRMFPNKGDYGGVPLNAEARRIADTWDPAKDIAERGQRQAHGAANIQLIAHS